MDKYREQPEALARGNFFTDFSHLDLNKKYSSSELLKFLRTKANVSDLLETNAQLIELIFRLASEEGNANFEVEDARGVFDTLGIRLDASDDRLTSATAQINNLVANAGDTDGNAELLDIRVGWDGVVYPTAGDAVRSIQQFMTEENEVWSVI